MCDTSSRIFHVHLKRLWILLFLDVMSCGLSNQSVSLKINFALLFFCLDDLSTDAIGLLKSPNIIVLL